MKYIIHYLSFVLSETEHTYLFQREDFSNGILSTDTFNSISQYISDLTGTPTPSRTLDLNLDTVMSSLNSYNISVAYSLATNFTNSTTGWSKQPYTAPTEKEEENG